VKAREVTGLDPSSTLDDNLRRIVEARLSELESFVPRALDPSESALQHDMRIAAKRLRYVLELSVPAFNDPAKRGAKAARRLQEVLGEVHDCDEVLARARERGGLERLLAHVTARRAVTFESFVREWDELRGELSAAARALSGPTAGAGA
jgi:CHAD domain-containing protein